MTRLDPDFVPPACLTELVAAGHVGIQAGRGFYEYEGRSVRGRLP
jgi:3-hydroxyacyl-CoA dehydrogenase